MKLTEGQRQHLFDLLIACDRPRPDTDALVKKGLAERGRGHFGEWVRITQKGIDTAKGWPEGERIAREARWINARTSKDSARTADRGSRAASAASLRAEVSPTEHQSMPAVAAKSKSVPHRSSTATAGSHTAPVHGRRRRASARGDDAAGAVSSTTSVTTVAAVRVSNCNTDVVPNATSAARVGIAQVPVPAGRNAAEVVPNAVRVTHANKVTYYPLSMFGSIKDATKQRCRTANRHYRSYALAASESDQVVL